MSKLIITVNGFDLAHRLPTKYSDFMFGILHRLYAVHNPHIPINDADVLLGCAGVPFAAFPDFNSLDEEPQEVRRQVSYVSVPFRLFDESLHVGGGRLELFKPRFFYRDGGVKLLLLGVVIAGEDSELLARDPIQHVILVEPFEERRQFGVPAPHGIEFFLHGIDFPPQFQAVLLVMYLANSRSFCRAKCVTLRKSSRTIFTRSCSLI